MINGISFKSVNNCIMEPNICKFIWNIRFLIGVVICIIILGPVGYYVLKSDEMNENEPNEEQQQGQGSDNNTTVKPIITTTTPTTTTISNREKWEVNEEVQIFREYLRIPTVHPNIDYRPCIAFLEQQATDLSLPTSISYPVDDENPVYVMTWLGSEPELPAIMLNSHMDVVPVFEEYWTHPPFAAEMDDIGDIFARGAQDMKSNGMQYLGAIRALKRDGIDRLKRTVHIAFIPDEEVGNRGMVGFVETDSFKSLSVGFVLDEGGLILDDEGALFVYHGERSVWTTEFIIHGHSGHGSLLFEDTPGEKLSYLLGKLTEYRKEEMRNLNELKYPYGNVTTINLTKVQGGVENNVIPAEFKITLDIRVSVNQNLSELEQMVQQWCEEAGGNITVNPIGHGVQEPLTSVDDTNPYWVAFKNATDELGLFVKTSILYGASDIRFIRRLNIPALGFSPLVNTIPKIHDHDEYINADTYLKGIDIYKTIIKNIASVP